MTLITVVFAVCNGCGAKWETEPGYQPFEYGFGPERYKADFCAECLVQFSLAVKPFTDKSERASNRKHAAAPALEQKSSPKVFDCKQCPATYTTRKQLNDHLEKRHGEVFEFECRGCGRRFETDRGRKRHETEMHPDLVSVSAA
jgi:transcription elongation factor Elf1